MMQDPISERGSRWHEKQENGRPLRDLWPMKSLGRMPASRTAHERETQSEGRPEVETVAVELGSEVIATMTRESDGRTSHAWTEVRDLEPNPGMFRCKSRKVYSHTPRGHTVVGQGSSPGTRLQHFDLSFGVLVVMNFCNSNCPTFLPYIYNRFLPKPTSPCLQ